MNPVNSPLQKHPDALRRAGLRSLQIRVPDSRQQAAGKSQTLIPAREPDAMDWF